MMFVSRVVVTIALNAQYLGGENMVDSLAAYILSMVLGFFIALPIWILNRKYPYLNVGDVAKLALGKAGKLVPVCYICLLYTSTFLHFKGDMLQNRFFSKA